MKSSRIVILAAAMSLCSVAAIAIACDGAKKSKTSASAASQNGASCCAKKGASATTAMAASQKGASGCTAEMAAACASHKGASAAAKGDKCAMKGNASAMAGSLCTHGTSASMASHGDQCAAKKNASASTQMAGANCGAHGHGATMAMNCDGCEDWAWCDGELKSAGARSQTVTLRNGVMFMYLSDSPEGVRSVQAAVAHRNERFGAMLKAADRAKLCGECKTMRGAMASGKLGREVVNVENGAQLLFTSSDKSIVKKLHDLASPTLAARVKS